MVPPKTVTLVALVCAVTTGLSGCLGRSASTTTAVTSTTIAATAAIANLAPTTLVGADPASEVAPSADPAPLAASGSDGPHGSDPTTAKGLPTPQAAARNLWDAWRDADGPRALLYATASATDVLMATAWGPEVHQSGCTAIEAGWLCRFEGPTVRWDLDIAGDDTLGYHVRRVSTGEPNGILLVPGVSPTQAAAGASSVPDASVTTTSEAVPGSGAAGSGSGRTAKRRRTSTTRNTRTTTPISPVTKPTGAQRSSGPTDSAPAAVTPAQPSQPATPPAVAPAPVPVANPTQNVG